MLTVDLCFSLVSLGNNSFGPPVKDKGFLLLSLCSRKERRQVRFKFSTKGDVSRERVLPSCLQKGLQGRVYLVVCGFKRVKKTEEWKIC